MTNSPDALGESESFIVIEGLLSSEDQRLVTDFIGRLGVQATYTENPVNTPRFKTPEDQLEAIQYHGYLFSDITRPDHILVREHFEDLGRRSTTLFRSTYARAFTEILDGRGIGSLYAYNPRAQGRSHLEQIREPKPLAGVQMVKRSTVGLPEHKPGQLELRANLYAKYGMTAGSVLNALAFTERLVTNKAKKSQLAMQEIARLLKEQLEQ